MKRPVSYKDWRSLWHSVAKELGWNIFFCWSDNKVLLNRRSWTLLYRLNRIWKRLQLESEVKDSSWCEAMFELLARN